MKKFAAISILLFAGFAMCKTLSDTPVKTNCNDTTGDTTFIDAHTVLGGVRKIPCTAFENFSDSADIINGIVTDTAAQIRAEMALDKDSLRSEISDLSDSATITLTFTGVAGSVTGTGYATKSSLVTCLYIPALSGNGNATSSTITGLSTSFRPARAQNIYVGDGIIDSMATVPGRFSIGTNGTITIGIKPVITVATTNTVTNTVTHGVLAQTVCWENK